MSKFIFFPQAHFDSIEINACSEYEIDLDTGKSYCTKDHPDFSGDDDSFSNGTETSELAEKATLHRPGYK